MYLEKKRVTNASHWGDTITTSFVPLVDALVKKGSSFTDLSEINPYEYQNKTIHIYLYHKLFGLDNYN